MTYLPNIPQPTDNLSVSQGQIQGNFSQLNVLFNIDHMPFSDTSGQQGYHTIIHQGSGTPNPVTGPTFRTRSGVGAGIANFPLTIASVNQLFVANYTPDSTVTAADTQLFNKTGLGAVSQLTGNLFGTTDGYGWVGGFLIQWGKVLNPAGSPTVITVTFKDRIPGAIPFPNNLFNVQLTVQRNSTGTNSHDAMIFNNIAGDFSITQFKFYCDSGGNTAIYWVAIGN